MKLSTSNFSCLLTVLMALAAVDRQAASAGPAPVATNQEVRSVFTYPSDASQGRDPFFPSSTRPYFFAKPVKPSPTAVASLTDLTLKSIIGTAPHFVAIINNHAFGEGDEGDIFTKTGRLHIKCVDINPLAHTATVEANGVTADLTLSKTP
jgi:hypothetical protein